MAAGRQVWPPARMTTGNRSTHTETDECWVKSTKTPGLLPEWLDSDPSLTTKLIESDGYVFDGGFSDVKYTGLLSAAINFGEDGSECITSNDCFRRVVDIPSEDLQIWYRSRLLRVLRTTAVTIGASSGSGESYSAEEIDEMERQESVDTCFVGFFWRLNRRLTVWWWRWVSLSMKSLERLS